MKQKLNIAFSLALILMLLITAVVLADDVANNADKSVDATYETVTLIKDGPSKQVDLYIVPQNGDGKQGCNLTGSTTLVLNVTSTNTSAATVSPTQITFTSCEAVDTNSATAVTVAPVSAGTTDITFSQVSNNSGGTFNLATASFTVEVAPLTPSNTAPVVSVTGVTGGATYEFGSVPSAGCSVTDAEDGSQTVSPVVGAVTGSLSSYGLGSQKVTCSYTDAGGLKTTASATYSIIDTTKPVLTLPTDITAEATSASGAAVSYSVSAKDAVGPTPVVSCTPASGSTFPLGTKPVSCSATDVAGNIGTGSFNVTVQDTTAPTVTLPANITAEATSASGAAVSYLVTATDLVDGSVAVSCTPASGSTFPLGTKPVSCSATDVAGNIGTGSFNVTVQDTTPPTIKFVSHLPAPNSFDWNNEDVIVNWSCADIVGVVSPSVSKTISSEGANQSTTGICTDTSGNTASDTQSGINIDKTAPTAIASRSPVANTFGWNNSDVTVSFSGSDGLSGLASCDSSVVLNSEGGGQSASGTCTDKAGNISAEATASGINIDKTAPSITWIGGPADGASYYFGSVPTAPSCTATDALSGENGCLVSVYALTVGPHTLTATAYDKAGNSKVETRSYTVLAWKLDGFFQPVDMNGVYNVVKNGSTIPLKFKIMAGTIELKETVDVKQPLTYVETSCDANALTDDIETIATGGTSLRYDTTGGQFIYNWKTPSTAGKCYRVTMTTIDSSTLVAYFKLK